VFLNSSTLGSLRFFAAAARHCSFKRAALELHVTQGAVSQQVKHLEEALGVKVFYRLTRQVTLTEEGRRLALVVGRALSDIEQAAQTIAASQTTIQVRLRAGPSFSLRWLIPRLANFYARNSGINLYVHAAYGLIDPAQPEFDLAIELVKGKLAGLQCENLMDEMLVPVCTPDYHKRHAFLRTPKDLARCTLLHDGHPWTGASEDAEWRHWLNAVGARRVESRRGQFFSLANMSIEAALTHQGIAMGRFALIRELIDSRHLVMPLKQRIKSPTRYCLVYPKDGAMRPGMRAVMSWLREQAASVV
jgi:LysR family transcriptional regulator, glycine cleavage system transcriptional activator